MGGVERKLISSFYFNILDRSKDFQSFYGGWVSTSPESLLACSMSFKNMLVSCPNIELKFAWEERGSDMNTNHCRVLGFC